MRRSSILVSLAVVGVGFLATSPAQAVVEIQSQTATVSASALGVTQTDSLPPDVGGTVEVEEGTRVGEFAYAKVASSFSTTEINLEVLADTDHNFHYGVAAADVTLAFRLESRVETSRTLFSIAAGPGIQVYNAYVQLWDENGLIWDENPYFSGLEICNFERADWWDLCVLGILPPGNYSLKLHAFAHHPPDCGSCHGLSIFAQSSVQMSFTESPLIEVEIDIKPGGFPNSINPSAMGVIPVAILGSDSFDVAEVDVSTLSFGPNNAAPAHVLTDAVVYSSHLRDENDDGFADLITHFRTRDTGITWGDTEATLSGMTLDGEEFEGTDSVRTVGLVRLAVDQEARSRPTEQERRRTKRQR